VLSGFLPFFQNCSENGLKMTIFCQKVRYFRQKRLSKTLMKSSHMSEKWSFLAKKQGKNRPFLVIFSSFSSKNSDFLMSKNGSKKSVKKTCILDQISVPSKRQKTRCFSKKRENQKV
jgi:hypothetical protein